jgi:hypothetical protein
MHTTHRICSKRVLTSGLAILAVAGGTATTVRVVAADRALANDCPNCHYPPPGKPDGG